MPCLSSTDFHTTSLVDIKWIVTGINQLRLPPMLLMTPRILRQRTVVYADHRGGGTQIFSGKASERETSTGRKCIVYRATLCQRGICHHYVYVRLSFCPSII